MALRLPLHSKDLGCILHYFCKEIEEAKGKMSLHGVKVLSLHLANAHNSTCLAGTQNKLHTPRMESEVHNYHTWLCARRDWVNKKINIFCKASHLSFL